MAKKTSSALVLLDGLSSRKALSGMEPELTTCSGIGQIIADHLVVFTASLLARCLCLHIWMKHRGGRAFNLGIEARTGTYLTENTCYEGGWQFDRGVGESRAEKPVVTS
ncbi:hypothetical protein CIHG_08523 [Coccidioides immitis H538.4]|uniref:Uncharacterized protein n=3 Tax=Coccidioides immitis TaxID=5501 RepID=A0A0J8TSZ5_COCIT|nr:hypothetical protein CIRG_09721 [Coccidioides immitis RMSCC 2394]KMU76917.1 hypothetical protein CISG_05959 [Coccidioides immitis RMSCC 3703]KMU90867.1 hypothetical protein CIHG_08523 [Coccidioides immitis H538.4]